MVRWRLAVAGVAVLTTTVLVTGGQPGNGVGFGLVVGLLDRPSLHDQSLMLSVR